jgi:parvulin-like peptidyl-prolyl isomerase
MSNTRPLSWIIAGLLLLNVIGTVMILLRITEIDEETTTTIVSAPLQQTDSISRIETDPEHSALPVQVSTDNAAVIINSTAPEKLPTDQASTEIVIAQVNGTDISQALLISYLNQLAPPEDLSQCNTLDDVPQNILMQSINNAALDELLVQLAVDRKLDQNPVIQADIRKNNRNILKTAYFNRLAPELVSNKDTAAQYETLVASLEGKLEYRARHILLANQKEARIVDEALEQKKKSFDELAKLFSLDEATDFRGGDLGYVLEGELNPEFEKVVNDLEIGQRSRPFETELGWHIVVVDDRRDSQPMSFAQASPVIRQKLEQQAIQKYLAALLDSATIDVLIAPDAATANLSSNDKSAVE